MSFIFEEVKFYDEFTGAGGGGTTYPNEGVMAKVEAWITGYFYLAYKNKDLRFDEPTKTITNINELDFSSFYDDGALVGQGLAPRRNITFENTASNNSTFTIDTISEDGRTITVLEAIVTEDALDCDLYDDTLVEALDFYYNLTPTNNANVAERNLVSLGGVVTERETDADLFGSLTDKGAIQRFSIDDLYASDVAPANMLVTSSSFGWVTNKITNQATGETSEVTVEGVDIVDHKQTFLIKQTFRISPFALAEQIENFRNGTPIPPDYFSDGNNLKYICKVDGKFDATDPNIPHTGNRIDTNSLTNWFNQNNIRSRAEYYFEAITYKDALGATLDSLDIEKVVSVVITIKSRSVPFHGVDSKFAVDFVYFPLNEERYIYTPDTTLIQNFLNDRRFLPIETINNGEQFGTAYQVLKDVNPLLIDDFTIEVSLDVDFSAEIKAFLKTLSLEDRNFFFSVTTQDSAISTTQQSDNVPVLAPVNQVAWDKSDSTLLTAVENIRAYHFPNIDENPKTSVGGYEGDPVYVQFPFRLESLVSEGVSPTINRVGMTVVSIREGKDDFVLEEKILEVSNERKEFDIGDTVLRQSMSIESSRNYIGMPVEYNTVSIERDESYDFGTLAGYVMSYAFVLRYDFWAKLISDAERFKNDIFEDITNPTEAWNTLQQNGWSLKVKFTAEVTGYTDFTEEFFHYWDIDCKYLGAEPDVAPIFESATTYFDVATGLQVGGIVRGGKTLISTTYTGDFSSVPYFCDTFYAYIFADLETIGGPQNRRFASSEFDSEDDSPFTAGALDLAADSSWASANLRVNIYNFTSIVASTIYEDKNDNSIERSGSAWSYRSENIIFFPRLGCFNGCFILTEVGAYVLNERGQRIQLESCEEITSS